MPLVECDMPINTNPPPSRKSEAAHCDHAVAYRYLDAARASALRVVLVSTLCRGEPPAQQLLFEVLLRYAK